MVKGSVVDFISVVRTLVPNIGTLVLRFNVIIFFHEIVKIIPVFIIKALIDLLALQPTMWQTVPYLVGIFVSLMLMLGLEVISASHISKNANRIQAEILSKTFDKLTALPLDYHEQHNSGAQVSKLTKAANYIHGLLWFLHNDIIPTLLQLILTTIILFWVDWHIGLLFIVLLPVVLLLIEKEFKSVQPLREQYQKKLEDSTRELAQVLINIQTVKGYGREEFESDIHTKILSEYCEITGKRQRMERPFWLFRDTITLIVRVASVGLGVLFLLNGQLTLGALVLVFTLVEKAFTNLFRLGRIYHFMGDTYEGLERVSNIYAQPITLTSGQQKPVNGSLVLSNVTFAYDSQKPILDNISLELKPGKVIALVGRSGSGKTTIAKLLTRQHDVTSGTISFGNISLRELQLQELRRSVLYVSQLTEIFDRTVHENIAYANPNATREEVIAAAQKASANDFILQLPQGYDTLVGERGVRLSGGQRQRIAIARALLADPYVIIFDEATSSLDTENEQAIQKAVFSIKNKTLIIIAHRLSTIKHADTVVVLESGKIVETGSHADLLKHKGVYHKMIELQKLGELRD